MSTSKKRDNAIDVARSIAIVTMIIANLAPLLPTPHSLIYRYLCSFPAPIFITLAGMMVAMHLQKSFNAPPLSYFIKRGIFLIFCGAFIDIIVYKEIPFISMDVLYLIGCGLPLAYLAFRLRVWQSIALVCAVLVTGVLLRHYVGYNLETFTIKIFNDPLVPGMLPITAKMWLIDGWFPLLPWSSYIILGTLLAKYRWGKPNNITSFNRKGPKALMVALLLTGTVLIYVLSGNLSPERAGYAEVFYPLTIEFFVLSLGVVLLVLIIADKFHKFFLFGPLMPMGEASLFVYISHLIMIEVIKGSIEKSTTSIYFSSMLAIVLTLLVATWGLRRFKRIYKNQPFVMRWLIGS